MLPKKAIIIIALIISFFTLAWNINNNNSQINNNYLAQNIHNNPKNIQSIFFTRPFINSEYDSSQYTLKKENNYWVIPEKANVRVMPQKINKFIEDLAKIKIQITQQLSPEELQWLNLNTLKSWHDTNLSPNPQESIYIQVFDKKEDTIFAQIFGKKDERPNNPSQTRLYSRPPNSQTVYISNGDITFPNTFLDWLDIDILGINDQDIAAISIINKNHSNVWLVKTVDSDNLSTKINSLIPINFSEAVEDIDSQQKTFKNVFGTLAYLTYRDIANQEPGIPHKFESIARSSEMLKPYSKIKYDELDFNNPTLKIWLLTIDANEIEIKIVKNDNQYWAKFNIIKWQDNKTLNAQHQPWLANDYLLRKPTKNVLQQKLQNKIFLLPNYQVEAFGI